MQKKITEYEVARISIQLMQENAQKSEKDASTPHVGYYLIGNGMSKTKKLAKTQLPVIEKTRHGLKRHALELYMSFI